MKSVRQLAEEIVNREGGFVNDPDDPGGATKYGVTIGTLRSIRGSASVQAVKALTRAEAIDIYVEFYFRRPRIDLLPEELQPSVFDMQVNAGSNAIKILQRMLNSMGEALVVDGKIGPGTVAAVKRQWSPWFVDAYGIERRNYYFGLADKRPASRKYCVTKKKGKGGWITRAEEFISVRYHLSAYAFAQRIKQWA